MPTVTEQIRAAIRQSGLSRYFISRHTGVGQSILCRLMAGRPIESGTMDKLAAYFGLKLEGK